MRRERACERTDEHRDVSAADEERGCAVSELASESMSTGTSLPPTRNEEAE
jgi:hypothetical protein